MKTFIFACFSIVSFAILSPISAAASQIESNLPTESQELATHFNGVSDLTRTNIVNDQFVNWDSSIFSPWRGTPTMSNGILTLPLNTEVVSNPISFSSNTVNRITLGNLNGTVHVAIWDHANGLVLAENTLTGNGNHVGFDYRHTGTWPATGQSIIGLYGNATSSSTSFFEINRL